jgi:predicted chitinase
MNLTNLSAKVGVKVATELPFVIEKFNIDNPLRLAHFLSHADFPSGVCCLLFDCL